MVEAITWLVTLSVVAALLAGGVVLVRAYLNGMTPAEFVFRPRPDPRIGVVEQASMDGKRRLILVRRDDVEHLIMTGGPVDVVIETGIGERKQQPPPLRADSAPAQSATVFTRTPRTAGQAGNEV